MPIVCEARDLCRNLGHGSDVRQRVERDSDVEMVFELADEFEHLQRVEAEIGEQFAAGRRINLAPAQALQNLDDFELDLLATGAFSRLDGGMPLLIGNLRQARKPSMNVRDVPDSQAQQSVCFTLFVGVRSISVNSRSIVRQTVILAAGNGSRLGSRASGVPKPLLPVAGEPLIAHALAHAQASGCEEAVVVVGYEASRVRAAVEMLPRSMRVTFVENPDPETPNGVSLLAAESLAAPRFFLQMVDHLFASPTLGKLAETPLETGEHGRVLVDRAPVALNLDDATRVRLSNGRVTAIGKGIAPWDAIDAGCFILTPAIFAALRQVRPAEPRTVSSGMRQLAARGELGVADVDGVAWVDVDTPFDHAAAERLLTVV
jgi:choline kinase